MNPADKILAEQWINPVYNSDPNYYRFAAELRYFCIWRLAAFGENFPWNEPVPEEGKFYEKICEFNDHLRMISARWKG